VSAENTNSGLREAIDRIFRMGAAFTSGDKLADRFAVIPSDMKVEDLGRYFDPPRIIRRVTLLDAGSFAEYVNRFKTDNTLVFANVSEKGATLQAVLDYHGAAPGLTPAHCTHSAIYNTIETHEWKTWQLASGKAMEQVPFATWLEDNAAMVVNPPGAELLEMVRSLHGHANARFASALRLDNGSYSASYEEDVAVRGTSTTRGGAIELPAEITAGIAPFEGAPVYEVRARLKSRVTERKLVLWFETIAPHKIVRDSMLLLVKQAAEKTGIIPLLGTP